MRSVYRKTGAKCQNNVPLVIQLDPVKVVTPAAPGNPKLSVKTPVSQHSPDICDFNDFNDKCEITRYPAPGHTFKQLSI